VSEDSPVVGFVGLGNMGGALAANLVAAGHDVVAFDQAGPERVPAGAQAAADVAEIARRAEVVVLSLPDGRASGAVCKAVIDTADRRTVLVIDTSTIGVQTAQQNAARLIREGVEYVDAPVSGGVAGARARTLSVMYASRDEACELAEPVLPGLSDRRRRVGDRPGLAQALKLANNFLSATMLAATSEAIAFGVAAGLDMATMLEVLDTSSGQSAATRDKFPNHVLTGRYAAGFTNSLMAKDLLLYLSAVANVDGAQAMGQATGKVWERFAEQEPNADFTRIYPFVAGE
jgi:3-hydroxyisobutyrate dehydrogenase